MNWTEDQVRAIAGKVRGVRDSAGKPANQAGTARSEAAPTTDTAKAKSPRVRGAVRVADPETGEMIDSKREARRLKELRLMLRAGEIDFLARQVTIKLEGATWTADFMYGHFEKLQPGVALITLEESKGVRTDRYVRSRNQLKARYGLSIKES